MNRQWARGFLLYCSKVHHVGRMVNRANDDRPKPPNWFRRHIHRDVSWLCPSHQEYGGARSGDSERTVSESDSAWEEIAFP